MKATEALELIKKHTAITDLKEVKMEDIWHNRNAYSLDQEGNMISLNLYGNKLKDISFVASLQSLQTLSFFSNQVFDLSPLKELKNLQHLWFQNNQVSDLSPLKELIKLNDLRFDSNKVSDLSPLKELINLQWLFFHFNQVSDLSPLKELKNLQHLWFQNNQVSDLLPLKELKNLQELGFNSNQVSDLSPLKELKSLQKIRCENNQISDLLQIRMVLALPKLEYLFAFGNPIQGIPIEKLGTKANDNCLEDLRNYFKQLDAQGTIQIYEAKMILVGEAGTGKTTLRKKLIDPAYPVPNPEDEKNSTHGIEITPALAFAHSPQPILANIWDFGGQHNYYSTHRYFLSPNGLCTCWSWTNARKTPASIIGFRSSICWQKTAIVRKNCPLSCFTTNAAASP
jgi:internalin A